MWHSATTSENSRMRERVTEDDEKQRPRQRNDGKSDTADSSGGSTTTTTTTTTTTGNIDSGFLSSGNVQFSGEICEEPAEKLKRQDNSDDRQGEQQVAAPATTTTATTIVREPMRVIDSGVDLDLSESLSQLSLQQVNLNPLAAKGDRIQAEPTDLELSPVSADSTAEEAAAESQRRRPNGGGDASGAGSDQRRAMIEESWQLYYAQDSDGDT